MGDQAAHCCFRAGALDETRRFAGLLAPLLRAGDIILLKGDLGAGKTAFARFLIQALTHPSQEVPSPTFTLIQTYEMKGGFTLWHMDLYRLQDPQEVYELGVEEAFETGLSLIEWPERLPALPLLKKALTLSIQQGEAPHERLLTLSGDAFWQERLVTCKEL